MLGRGDVMTPVVVGKDSCDSQTDSDRSDDEENLGQIARGLPNGDVRLNGLIIERGDRPVEGHTRDHDDDRRHGEGDTRQGGA